MKICVASAHAQCEEDPIGWDVNRAQLWQELQWKFLKETTTSQIEYYVIANALNPKPFEKYADGVLHIPNKSSHSTCLKEILTLFATSNCTHCLLLDSDCWPIREDWDIILREHCRNYRFAAPIRTENLDVFPHPCSVFFPKSSLSDLDFGFTPSKNLLGNSNSDVGSALTMDGCYPLMKTNYISPHPVYASIYGDMFYHHCAGSRGTGVRCADYYRHMISLPQQRKIYLKITQQLRKNPKKFIDALRGVQSRVSNSAVKI